MKIKRLTKKILKASYIEEMKKTCPDKKYLLYLHNRIIKLK